MTNEHTPEQVPAAPKTCDTNKPVQLREADSQRADFMAHLKQCSSEVSTWPTWKQEALGRLVEHQGVEGARSARDQNWLAYTDPEASISQNEIVAVSVLRAGEAFNDLCKMLGGRWPDARIEESAPVFHKFMSELLGFGAATKNKDVN
ncbi:hypothetical protein ACYPKM_00530 [Pseudomonas aeruginosa]